MHLLKPSRIGSIAIQNRIIHAPLTRTRADQFNVPGELMATYYAQRASAGLLIAEATMVANGTQAWLQQPSIHSQAHIDGWRLVTDAVHAQGGKIILQIWHPGRATHSANSGADVVSSTNRAITGTKIHTSLGKQDYPAPRRLRTDELPGIVQAFKQAAINAKAAGFDGVQIHGAHGYLVDQFLRDGANDRQDLYGGSIANRARLLFEIIDAVSTVYEPAQIGVRISPVVLSNDVTDSDPVALTNYVAQQAAARGLGHFEVRHANPDDPIERAVAQAARKWIQTGLILNGGFTQDSGEQALIENRADAIAYGRMFLANPDLPARFAQNAALNAVDESSLYTTGSPKGYIDYPALAA